MTTYLNNVFSSNRININGTFEYLLFCEETQVEDPSYKKYKIYMSPTNNPDSTSYTWIEDDTTTIGLERILNIYKSLVDINSKF